MLSCERVLQEIDGVLTAVRIVELLQLHLPEGIEIEKQVVPITILVIGKFDLTSSGKNRVVQLQITRPNGEVTKVGEPHDVAPQSKSDDIPPGFNLIAGFGIIAKQLGLHWVSCLIDEEEVARIPIILQRLPSISAG
jgi:hypothetical protein